MIIMRDLEERAEVALQEAEAAVIGARERLELQEELDAQRLPLRRRLASALIGIGRWIDPEAVETSEAA